MDKRIESYTSKAERQLFPMKWRIEAFESLTEKWVNFRSPRLEAYAGCCGLSLSISLQNVESVTMYKIEILHYNTTRKDNLGQHLAESHYALLQTAEIYIMGGDGHEKFAMKWDPTKAGGDYIQIVESELLKSLSNGCLEIHLDLEITRMVHRSYEIQPKSIEQPEDIGIYLERLLENGLHSDFEIKLKGEVLKVHKNVLAIRSQYFYKMFSTGMKESQENFLSMKNIDCDVVKKMIRFIYTNKLEFTDDPVKDKVLATEILRLADQYQLVQLKPLCEVNLIKKISTDNIVEMLRLAHAYNADNLRQGAIEFIRLNKSSLATQDDFQDLVANSPKLGADILDTLFKMNLT